MFEHVEPAQPDAIIGINEAFQKDTNPSRINLSVGVYKDAQNRTPVLASVKAAERRIVEEQTSKAYLPITGSAKFAALVQELLFGAGHEIITSDRAGTAHTPGGTGALRVAADYLHKNHPDAAIWLSDPTWENHGQIFTAAGLEVKTYSYFDRQSNGLALDAMLETLKQASQGDVVLLHGCCHNPTGVDPTPTQWAQIAEMVAQRKLLPLVDFAYQGFGLGLSEDADGLGELALMNRELIVCSSFSKNFGLYCDRTGAMTIVARDTATRDAVMSQVKRCIRTNYSNPPAHGGAIVTTVLGDADLRKQWVEELAEMRDRIQAMRWLLVSALDARGIKLPGGDNSFITEQKGMFSFSGLSREQVQRLRDEFSIYIVGSGRINVAGISEANIDALADAIAKVL